MGPFRSAYEGELYAFVTTPKREVRSIPLSTLVCVLLQKHPGVTFNPVNRGGKGFSVRAALRIFPHMGKSLRVASATPKPYLARVYCQQDFGFGPLERNQVIESRKKQSPGTRP